MLKFISFGSGSSGNSYFLYTETDGLLIDAGVGVRALKRHFKEYGLSLSNVKNILVTHDHADHVRCVGNLSRDYDIPVYATERVHQGIRNNYCVKCKISQERTKIIEKGSTFQINDFKITSFGVPHDSTDCVGYQVRCYGVCFVVMTDVGHVTDEMKPFIASANYLVIEANHDEEMLLRGSYPKHLQQRILSDNGHLSNYNCGVAITENATPELKHVWLCHISEDNNHPELARKTVEQVLRSHGIIAGTDFQLEVLRRKIPSEIYDLV